MSLIEVIMAVALLAMGILFVASLIPSSVLTLKKAEDLQAASAYGAELIENGRLHPPSGEERREYVVPINATEFHFVREIYSVNDELYDVVVLAEDTRAQTPPCAWRRASTAPWRARSAIARRDADRDPGGGSPAGAGVRRGVRLPGARAARLVPQ